MVATAVPAALRQICEFPATAPRTSRRAAGALVLTPTLPPASTKRPSLPPSPEYQNVPAARFCPSTWLPRSSPRAPAGRPRSPDAAAYSTPVALMEACTTPPPSRQICA